MEKGYLVLETGELFEGNLIGEKEAVVGEVVFNTSMTEFQGILSNPSYAGQIITFCYPLIGNGGLSILFGKEAKKPAAKGVILGNIQEEPNRSNESLNISKQLQEAGVSGLANVDTRAIVQAIRKHGTIKGMITSELLNSDDKLKQRTQLSLVEQVSTNKVVTYKNEGPHVVLIDYGYKQSILDALRSAGCSVTVVPYDFTYQQIKVLNPDGVILSNGPGDPVALTKQLREIKQISEAFPTLGINLGHQLIALAHGGKTNKLAYGHRGSNHPVKDLETGKVVITAQNHGYVVIDESVDKAIFHVTFENVNDKTIEGLKHRSLPIQTVQFHPEAHPGPSDTAYVFTSFIQQVSTKGGAIYAVT